jgi:predicted metal-dependent peptidase
MYNDDVDNDIDNDIVFAENVYAKDFSLLSLADSLSSYHELFYSLFNMGHPSFTKEISTACVLFSRFDGAYMQFLFNPKFFTDLSKYGRNFVFCHECMHIVYDHGKRMKNRDPKISNIAMDLAVNHSLINKFGFDYNYLDEFLQKGCFIWNIFTEKEIEEHNISDNGYFEYYYNLLIKHGKNEGNVIYVRIDDHSTLTDKNVDEILKELSDNIHSNNLDESIRNEINKHHEANNDGTDNKNKMSGQQAGTQKGTHILLAIKQKIIKKRKWETVIKKWTKKADKTLYKDQFVAPSRRYYDIINSIKDSALPTKYPYKNEKNKIELWAFQDTSGSCVHLKDRFFGALETIPTDRFNLRVFCFDTSVYEVDMKTRKLYGFGGTYFDIIERYIQNKHKQLGVRYPDAVFIITDGYGNKVQPEFPEKWHWFLSDNYTQCIPNECNKYMLSDYE